MFCKNCGNELSDGALFCPKCGSKIISNDESKFEKSIDSVEISTENKFESTNNELNNGSNMVNKQKKKSIKKKILYIILIIISLVLLLNMCSGDSEHKDDANVSLDDIIAESDYAEYSDNKGDDVPVIVNNVSYGESDFVGFMDIRLDVTNTTENDYRDMTFIALAWDSNGYPIEFDYTDDPYPYTMTCNNLGPNATEQYSWQHGEYYKIAYMSVFLVECTDFEGNTWKNPAMDYVDEHKGEKLQTTKLSYFTFGEE